MATKEEDLLTLSPVKQTKTIDMATSAPSPGDGNIANTFKDLQLVINTIPDFATSAQIIGVCGVRPEETNSEKQRWMIQDFVDFKMALYKKGKRDDQIWLSTVDIKQYMDEEHAGNDKYLAGVLGPKGDYIKSYDSSSDLESEFLMDVAQRTATAAKNKTDLVIFYVGMVTPEQDFCLDVTEMHFLTLEKIRAAICEGAQGGEPRRVVLVTTSPLTGGWLCRPVFFGDSSVIQDEVAFRILAKDCGAAFAKRIINSMLSRDGPFLSANLPKETRQRLYYEPMPVGATPSQIQYRADFFSAIHLSLQRRFTATTADKHGLSFDSTDDAWLELGPRRGWTLDQLKEGFIGHERNTSTGYNFLGSSFGGSKESQIFHLQNLVKIELATCPGDWTTNSTGLTPQLFNAFLRSGRAVESDVKEVYDVIEFRGSCMVMAQLLADHFKLPVPADEQHGLARFRAGFPLDNTVFRRAFGILRHFATDNDKDHIGLALAPGRIRHDFNHVRFWRASQWLDSCIADRFGNAEAAEEFIKKNIWPVLDKIRYTQIDLLLQSEEVSTKGVEWLKAIKILPGDVPEKVLDAVGASQALSGATALLQTPSITSAVPVPRSPSFTGWSEIDKISPFVPGQPYVPSTSETDGHMKILPTHQSTPRNLIKKNIGTTSSSIEQSVVAQASVTPGQFLEVPSPIDTSSTSNASQPPSDLVRISRNALVAFVKDDHDSLSKENNVLRTAAPTVNHQPDGKTASRETFDFEAEKAEVSKAPEQSKTKTATKEAYDFASEKAFVPIQKSTKSSWAKKNESPKTTTVNDHREPEVKKPVQTADLTGFHEPENDEPENEEPAKISDFHSKPIDPIGVAAPRAIVSQESKSTKDLPPVSVAPKGSTQITNQGSSNDATSVVAGLVTQLSEEQKTQFLEKFLGSLGPEQVAALLGLGTQRTSGLGAPVARTQEPGDSVKPETPVQPKISVQPETPAKAEISLKSEDSVQTSSGSAVSPVFVSASSSDGTSLFTPGEAEKVSGAGRDSHVSQPVINPTPPVSPLKELQAPRVKAPRVKAPQAQAPVKTQPGRRSLKPPANKKLFDGDDFWAMLAS